MTPAQKRLRELTEKRSKDRQRMAELSLLPELSDEHREELDKIEKSTPDTERQIRAATTAVEDEEAKQTRQTADHPDAEMRERIELRSKASLTAYLQAALAGRQVNGAEAELQQAAGVNGIPLELWDTHDRTEQRADATTGAPGTVGVNLDRIQPAVFANSIAPRLGIEMPRVQSGTYASPTLTTSLTAASKAKGAAAEATAAGFTVTSVTPKRVSARLAIRVEDIAAAGTNLEAAIRENLSLVLSDELDKQALNGTGGNSGADLKGIFNALTDPTDPTDVAVFDDFVSAFAGGVDGLWAHTVKDVGIVCGPATYQLSAKTFRDVGTNNGHRGDIAFSDYAMEHMGGWFTNKRMPDAASDIQQAILYRKGRSMRTAVCPHWNEISIDDIYSGSAQGERFFTMHVLLGDVILVQPDAYKQVAYKLA